MRMDLPVSSVIIFCKHNTFLDISYEWDTDRVVSIYQKRLSCTSTKNMTYSIGARVLERGQRSLGSVFEPAIAASVKLQ